MRISFFTNTKKYRSMFSFKYIVIIDKSKYYRIREEFCLDQMAIIKLGHQVNSNLLRIHTNSAFLIR